MRFSTKILLLTLSITVGLGAIVVIVVRRGITTELTDRAKSDIERAAENYLRQLDAIQQRVTDIAPRELATPNNRSLLDAFTPDASPDDLLNAQFQIGEEIFEKILQKDLDAPIFHALVNAKGQICVAKAFGDESLERALRGGSIEWHIGRVLRGEAMLKREYLLIGGTLHIGFAAPLRQTEEEDPAFCYFAGWRVTDQWARKLLDAPGENKAEIAAWFIVDGRVVARGTERELDAANRKARLDALLAQVPSSARPGGTGRVRFDVGGEPFIGQYTVFEPSPGVRGMLALTSSLEQTLAPLRRLQRQIAIVTGIAGVLAVIAARWIARRLARPVEQLVEGTQRIAEGDFTHTINVNRNDELGELARSFNQMADGLAQRDLIKDTLGQFVDPRIADALLTNPASLRGQRLVQSVLFSDLEKFTSISEKLEPEVLVAMLNRFLGASADAVKEQNGYLDKFMGDGVIAFWGPPVELNHSIAACRVGLTMIELARKFHDPPLRVRVGVATGEVLVGIIGSGSSKKNYTAMGDVVNLASRLEGANKVYGTQILIDYRTASEVQGVLATRKIDIVRVVGRAEPVELHEVVGESDTTDGSPGLQRYEKAMALYGSRRWSDAREAFAAIDDPPSRVMSKRCEAFIGTEPASEWDGVWNLEVK